MSSLLEDDGAGVNGMIESVGVVEGAELPVGAAVFKNLGSMQKSIKLGCSSPPSHPGTATYGASR